MYLKSNFKSNFKNDEYNGTGLKPIENLRSSFIHNFNNLHKVEKSNCGRESLHEVQRQNIARHCQQTFENKKFLNTQQCFALLHQVNFPANNLNFL